jgi:hypothetical protein
MYGVCFICFHLSLWSFGVFMLWSRFRGMKAQFTTLCFWEERPWLRVACFATLLWELIRLRVGRVLLPMMLVVQMKYLLLWICVRGGSTSLGLYKHLFLWLLTFPLWLSLFHSVPPHNVLNWPCYYQLQDIRLDFVWPHCCNIIHSVVNSLKHVVEERVVFCSKYSYTVCIEV